MRYVFIRPEKVEPEVCQECGSFNFQWNKTDTPRWLGLTFCRGNQNKTHISIWSERNCIWKTTTIKLPRPQYCYCSGSLLSHSLHFSAKNMCNFISIWFSGWKSQSSIRRMPTRSVHQISVVAEASADASLSSSSAMASQQQPPGAQAVTSAPATAPSPAGQQLGSAQAGASANTGANGGKKGLKNGYNEKAMAEIRNSLRPFEQADQAPIRPVSALSTGSSTNSVYSDCIQSLVNMGFDEVRRHSLFFTLFSTFLFFSLWQVSDSMCRFLWALCT